MQRYVPSSYTKLTHQRKSNELTITPRSAESVLVVGRAADYAQCEVRRKDGSRCNAYVSKHKGNGVCEYHLEKAIVGQQHGRMEFAAGCVRPNALTF